MSNLTLIIDGNWLLMSRLSVLVNKYDDDKELNNQLRLLMIRSIKVMLNQFKCIDNIIFVADGASWRTSINIPEFLKEEDIEYKGNRIKSDTINWDMLFSEFDNFMSILREGGITTCKEYQIEGDDWCWWWSTLLNKQDTSCMIWSSDRDLTQLLKINPDNHCFTCFYNQQAGLILPEYNTEEIILFNPLVDRNDNLLSTLISKSHKTSYIKPNEVIIDKILRGDSGDNIRPLMLREGKSRKYRISTKDVDRSLNIWDDNECIQYLTNLYNSKTYKNKVRCSLDEVIEHFKYNRILVTLDEKNYPEAILNKLSNYITYIKSSDISIAENKINAESNSLTSILDMI